MKASDAVQYFKELKSNKAFGKKYYKDSRCLCKWMRSAMCFCLCNNHVCVCLSVICVCNRHLLNCACFLQA